MMNFRNFFFKSNTCIPVKVFLAFLLIASCNQKKQKSPEKEQLQLGRYLFYDRRLSINNTKACATCHAQEFSFTDSYTRSIGALGDLHQRNARPLINLSSNRYFTAADSSVKSLLEQMNRPMFNEHPIEMGVKGHEEKVLKKIQRDSNYQQLFKAVYGNTSSININNIQKAIEVFISTIHSYNSAYDKFLNKQASLTQQEQEGRRLFFSNKLQCSKCHGGNTFNMPELKTRSNQPDFYQNTGLYNLNNNYPSYDQGLYEKTNYENDKGKYRIPTLRNLAFTAPYFHDGSAATLADVIVAYEAGGRNITEGIYKGDGRKNKFKNPLVQGFKLTLVERKALISFLFALSDSSILHNPAYANPFKNDETK